MNLNISNKKKILIGLLSILLILVLIILMNYNKQKNTITMVMGGKFYNQTANNDYNAIQADKDVETYFRPSAMPVLNNRHTWRFFDNYYGKDADEITLSDELISTPEDTILNYFSVLREAANAVNGKGAGCGSVGYGNTAYPVAYNFLTDSYQDKMSYKQYLKTFENILHMSLLKYIEVPVFDNPNNIIRYFVELETIEGNERFNGNFAYYYGFVDLSNDKGGYKISNLEFHGENYLCAPYHGWSHIAEASVQIRYGDWCNLIKEMNPTIQEGYIKNVPFHGTDDKDYLIIFFQLTNDTDVEIAQYVKGDDGSWELIKLNPEECLKDKEQ
jgi:hypothetical protein